MWIIALMLLLMVAKVISKNYHMETFKISSKTEILSDLPTKYKSRKISMYTVKCRGELIKAMK